MAHLVQLHNKIFIGSIILLLSSCNQLAETKAVSNLYINVDSGGWKEAGPLLYHNGFLFSGSKFKLYPNRDTAFLYSYLNGKQEGLQYEWYPAKKTKQKRNFINGWQEGEQSGWYENGKTSFIYHFKNDVYDGNLKEWYEEGKLFRDCNYSNGQEAGKQLFLNLDGSIKANYEVRNGKIYGNTGTKNCASPWKAD